MPRSWGWGRRVQGLLPAGHCQSQHRDGNRDVHRRGRCVDWVRRGSLRRLSAQGPCVPRGMRLPIGHPSAGCGRAGQAGSLFLSQEHTSTRFEFPDRCSFSLSVLPLCSLLSNCVARWTHSTYIPRQAAGREASQLETVETVHLRQTWGWPDCEALASTSPSSNHKNRPCQPSHLNSETRADRRTPTW